MIKLNLIGDDRKIRDFLAEDELRKWWKADKQARSAYAEHQWKMLEESGFLDSMLTLWSRCCGGDWGYIYSSMDVDWEMVDAVHWSCMFQDRTVRRRYDKRLRDSYYREEMPCAVCGTPCIRGKWVQTPACNDECRATIAQEIARENSVTGMSREELQDFDDARRAKYPKHRIGAQSLKVLNTRFVQGKRAKASGQSKHGHFRGTIELSTTPVMRNHPDTPANVKGPAWKGHKARCRKPRY